MRALLYQWLAAWRVSQANTRAVSEQADRGNWARLRWMALCVVPVNLACVLLFWHLLEPPGPLHALWQRQIGAIHLAMAGLLALLGIAAHRAHRAAAVPRGAGLLHPAAPGVALLLSALLAIADQRITASISPYLLGSVAVALAFHIRPGWAVALYALSYGLFFMGMPWLQADAAQVLSNRVNGLFAALLGASAAILMWHRNARYTLLQRELERRNAALVQQREELTWLAKRDALTGLLNRGEFLRIAEAELLRARRHETDTSAIMIDLDHFKAINDRHGHPAGDRVLKHAASLLLGGVRGTDTVARVGGEEFVILLPETAQLAAMALAEKLRLLLRQSTVRLPGELSLGVTASLGVATVPAGYEGSVAALYAAADHALYQAKEAGRDRVAQMEPNTALTPSDFQRLRRS